MEVAMLPLDQPDLLRLLRSFAYRTGPEFKLSSGRTSTEYVDIKGMLCRPDLGCELITSLASAAHTRFGHWARDAEPELDAVARTRREGQWPFVRPCNVVAGVPIGGDALAFGLSQHAWLQHAGRYRVCIFVRLEERAHGLGKQIEGDQWLLLDKSPHILLVE